MDSLILVGLSHKTAPIDIREQVAFSEEQVPTALQVLLKDMGCEEGMILSTCNRVELLARAPASQDLTGRLPQFLHEFHSLPPGLLNRHLYTHTKSSVVRHVFRVAGSLDSMVVGEPQILSQLKEAFRTANNVGSVGRRLNHLIPRAFFVAKRIRTETRIASAVVSVSSVAVELAQKIFGELHGKAILMIGAGKMGELAGRNLVSSGVSEVYVTNRTPEKAAALSDRFNGHAVPYEDLDTYLGLTDIVLVSTGAKNYVLDRRRLDAVLRQRRYRPLFIIDISVPRNVDPLVNEMENVFLYDIDDLQAMIESNRSSRLHEAETAERIVDDEVEKFIRRLSADELGPVIAGLRSRMESICLEDLRRNHNGVDREQYEILERILLRAAHKLAHPLIRKLKEPIDSPSSQLQRIEWIKEAFSLDDTDE